MSVPRQFDALARVDLPARPVHLAIGMFDGVHLGHQSVIEVAAQAARSAGGLAGVLTFWPHPSRVLRPESRARMILTREQRRKILARFDLDFAIEQSFTLEFAAMGARDFVGYLHRCIPLTTMLYVGENWRFGRDREGDVASLVAQARPLGLGVFSAPRLHHNGEPVSSSRIRTLIESGDIEEANALLGYSYFSEGIVRTGRRLGREIGFPTLNLSWSPDLQPRMGVYVVSVVDAAGRTSLGVANYGLRPTVETAAEPLLEVHILGDTRLGPGASVTVHWLKFLRPEKRFAGIEELRAQIALDRRHALLYFAKIAQA